MKLGKVRVRDISVSRVIGTMTKMALLAAMLFAAAVTFKTQATAMPTAPSNVTVIERGDTVEVITRAECRKKDDRGCTAHTMVTIKAPEGKYLIPESLTHGEVVNTNNKGGFEPLCGPAKATGTVPYQIPGTNLIAYFYTSAEAYNHVESGSGFADINQVFFVNCKYTFRTGTLPH